MANEPASFYGRILIVLGVVIIAGLYTSGNSTNSPTGFAVKEADAPNSFFDVQTFEGDPRVCADGSLNGECSSLIKPKFCVYGTLVDYCELCGCDAGEVCKNRECVKAE